MVNILKELSYKNLKYIICEGVYEPSDDTFLLIDNLMVNDGDFVLEIGTGTGLVAMIASQQAKKIIATDVSSLALKCASQNIKLNDLTSKIELREGQLFEPIHPNERFDVILINPPYLPADSLEIDDTLTQSWSSGKDGRTIIDEFLQYFDNYLKKHGRVQLIQSSLSMPEETIRAINKKGMKIEKISEKNFFYEKIILFLIKND